jgi:hypothetical protein
MIRNKLSKIDFDHAIDSLKDRLLNASRGAFEEGTLTELARFFAESDCSKENEDRFYGEISHSDYLVNIVVSLSRVNNEGDSFFENGRKLVDVTNEVYVQNGTSSLFTGFVLPSLAESDFIRDGRELVRGAEIVANNRGDVPGEVYFPRLNLALEHGAFSDFAELSRYTIPFGDFSISSKKMIVPSKEQIDRSKDYSYRPKEKESI